MIGAVRSLHTWLADQIAEVRYLTPLAVLALSPSNHARRPNMSEIVANVEELWELHERFNTAGISTSIPVVSANGVFWMSYPHEDDSEVLNVAMESGDPQERMTMLDWPESDEYFYTRVHTDDPIIVYPLTVLWTPEVSS